MITMSFLINSMEDKFDFKLYTEAVFFSLTVRKDSYFDSLET